MKRRQRELPDVLAQALVDGHDVNWAAAEELADDASTRGLVRRFRDLSEVLGHGGRLDTDTSGSGVAFERSAFARVPLWGKAVILLSLLQIALALVGWLGGRPDERSISPVMPALSTLAFTAGALWVMHAGRRDRRALHLGGFLLVNAVASSRRFLNWATPFLPAWVGHLPFFNAFQPEAFFAAFLWSFVAEFPRVVRLGRYERLIRFGTRVSVLAGTVLLVVNAVVFYFPGVSGQSAALAALTRQHPSGLYWTVLFSLSVAAIAVAVLRLGDASRQERARVHLFVAGLIVGVGPLLVDVLLYYLQASWYQPLVEALDPRGWRTPILYGFVLLVPVVASASVVLEDPANAFQRLRAALGWRPLRSGLGTLSLLFGVSLLTFAYGHRAEPFEQILASAVVTERFAWMLAFGAGYALVPKLRRVVFQVREARRVDSRMEVEATTADSVESSLRAWVEPLFHPERLFLLVPGAASRRTYEPAFGGARALPADSALASIALGAPGPIPTGPNTPGSLFSWLPSEEQDWVLDNKTSLLTPIPSPDGSGRLVGFLGLGPRRDGRVYSSEDERVLHSIASACGPTVERFAAGGREEGGSGVESDEPARECSRCGRVASPAGDSGSCPCGAALRVCSVPWFVGDKLRLTQRLGAGAMGVVYAAEDLELGRLVAVKALPRVSPEGHLRLRQEARAMARMSHPNVATIYGLESWRGVPLLLVEYLEGGTLEDRAGVRREMAESVRIVCQIADGLIALHADGLVHRDIKPSNVGLTREGAPKLMDFGLARQTVVEPDATMDLLVTANAGESASASSLAGTPLYLPPECWEGRRSPGVGQDLWALSMVLYELLVGHHPLRDAGAPAGRSRKAYPPIPEARELSPGIPEGLAEFLRLCLRPDPAARPQSAVLWKELLLQHWDPI